MIGGNYQLGGEVYPFIGTLLPTSGCWVNIYIRAGFNPNLPPDSEKIDCCGREPSLGLLQHSFGHSVHGTSSDLSEAVF